MENLTLQQLITQTKKALTQAGASNYNGVQRIPGVLMPWLDTSVQEVLLSVLLWMKGHILFLIDSVTAQKNIFPIGKK